jgi:hypothetical protein
MTQTARPDREALIEAISGVVSIIKQRGYPDVDIEKVRPKVIRLLEEGLTFDQICKGLIAVANAKEDDQTLGLRASSKTTVADLDTVAEKFGINADTPENRAAWEKKFKDGRARYWCPKCGYAGNGEFGRGLCDDILCFRCTFSGDSRYFTRKWTTEEQAEYEEQVRREREEHDHLYLEKTKQARRQFEFMQKLKSEAVTVVKQLYAEGNCAFDEAWDACDRHIKWVMQIMSRCKPLPTPDEVIESFRTELDNDMTDVDEVFEEVARRIDKGLQGETND